MVKSGVVKVSIRSHDAGFDRIARAGSVLGLPATMSGKPYSLDAEVLEESRIVQVTRQMVLKGLGDNPELCLEVLGLLGREVQQLREQL